MRHIDKINDFELLQFLINERTVYDNLSLYTISKRLQLRVSIMSI